MTAQAVAEAQLAPYPYQDTSPLLREQHFGIAEGVAWTTHRVPGLSLKDHIAKGACPAPLNRSETFPEGECTNDLTCRALLAVQELLLPWVWKATRERRTDIHVAVVSHELCIAEILVALVRMDSGAGARQTDFAYDGLQNTAWARVSVQVKVGRSIPLELRPC
jgi:broad specificity phosphatase PhoE